MSSVTPNPYSWKYVLLSQVYLIVISVVLTYYPQYFIEAIITYFIVMMGVMFYSMSKSNPMFRDRKLLYEINNSRLLYEEKNASELINKDKEYTEEYTKYAKKSFSMLGIYLVYMIVLYFLYTYISKIALSQASSFDRLLVYLIYFEVIYLFAFFVFRKIVKPAMLNIMAPFSYKITEKGIVGSGGMSTFLHARHLLDANISVNREKHYVEIDSAQAKLPYKLRLYSSDVDKVVDYIERIKRIELRRQSSSQ